jgi:hypothetical protein
MKKTKIKIWTQNEHRYAEPEDQQVVKSPAKAKAKPAAASKSAKVAGKPARQMYAVKRKPSIVSTFVKFALAHGTRKQLAALYSDPRLTPNEKALIFADIMEQRRTYIP